MIANYSTVDLNTFRKYAGVSLPRHVSYPMPTWWTDLEPHDIAGMLNRSNEPGQSRDVSLYVHVPFCRHLCKYCACLRAIQPSDRAESIERTEAYVKALIKDVRNLASRVREGRRLRQIHWGGGTPTYLSDDQIARVQRAILESFDCADHAEVSMEIDPRVTSAQTLLQLRELGFNRLSLGVQDFDDTVQKHVNRVQPYDLIREFLAYCRQLEFDGVNFDLIYGLPYQTMDSIRRTLDLTIGLGPDRIAFYHYAQIPEKVATQRGMDYTRLPDSETKLAMFLMALERFTGAGYEFIGLDHFARPDEGLCRAHHDGTIQRNFQGMTTGGGLDLLGVGATSISHLLGTGFMQNVKAAGDYIDRIENGKCTVERGKWLTAGDYLRQTVIGHLYCLGEVRPAQIEAEFGIDFYSYFDREMKILGQLERDGLVKLDAPGVIRVTCPLGRVLLRTIAAVFDAYVDKDAYLHGEKHCFSVNA